MPSREYDEAYEEKMRQIQHALREFGKFLPEDAAKERRDVVNNLLEYLEEEERRERLHKRFDRLSTEEMEKLLGPEPPPEPELSEEEFYEKFPELKNSAPERRP